MTNEFLGLGPKRHTYKISGDADFARNVPYLVGALNQVDEVIPTSIKVYGIIGESCKFKFKGTEKALRNLLSELSTELDFKVKKVKKVLF